ncbi:alpha/beta hydrolase [Croceicoccus sp. BE223]|uniref:RBBP9/YdeN family alpha/beta hydrolase n=1 Tax=Croceicoccus sp. BE223 TaxID=2817716 RepID=UPI002862C071|nr:alpha/beta hydrolase [Croceicoccus sp. BE223]MDR7102858.1 putative alpha/beta hydrolase family esterase [Croceicoccus sp. BE223]
MAKNDHRWDDQQPLVLIVPGLNDSGPHHWQTLWEQELSYCRRVQLGMWDNPHRNTWVNQINLAIHKAAGPVILVAHSLACHALAWWAEYERPAYGNPVVGALLVAPPDVESAHVDERLKRFAPLVERRLPFRSILAASRNDPYASFGLAKRFARKWGSRLVDAGPIGHINAESGIADWPYGKYLLDHLVHEVAPTREPRPSTASVATHQGHRGHGSEARS